jgi:hypothetical protein
MIGGNTIARDVPKSGFDIHTEIEIKATKGKLALQTSI